MKNNNLALTPEVLYHACDMPTLTFKTTDELEEPKNTIGQDRALEALNFGTGIKHEGYNLFVSGSTGLGKHTINSRSKFSNTIFQVPSCQEDR